jgi:hypothetical protein
LAGLLSTTVVLVEVKSEFGIETFLEITSLFFKLDFWQKGPSSASF